MLNLGVLSCVFNRKRTDLNGYIQFSRNCILLEHRVEIYPYTACFESGYLNKIL